MMMLTKLLSGQDENVPWYSDERWDFVKGNLSSVDRDYGWAHHLTHHIGTHQVMMMVTDKCREAPLHYLPLQIHHLFTKIPHYHLEEATSAFRARFPHLVRRSQEPILPAFLRIFFIFERQQWVEDDVSLHVYRGDRGYNK